MAMQSRGIIRVPSIIILKSKNICSRCKMPTNIPMIVMDDHYYICAKCYTTWIDDYYDRLPYQYTVEQYKEYLQLFKDFKPAHKPFLFR